MYIILHSLSSGKSVIRKLQILHRGRDGRVWWTIETEDLAVINQIVDEDGSSARRIMPATSPETDTPSVAARATNAQ